MPGKRGLDPKDRFMQYIVVNNETGCHEFVGGKSHGYGRFGFKREDGKWKKMMAHRFSWSFIYGNKIEDDQDLLHKCDNPPCCNPSHLFVGYASDNVHDMARKNRGRRGKNKLLPYGAKFRKDIVSRPFCSEIRYEGKQIYLGYYKTAETASAVARSRKDLIYGLRPDDSDYEGAEWGDYDSCIHAESRQ